MKSSKTATKSPSRSGTRTRRPGLNKTLAIFGPDLVRELLAAVRDHPDQKHERTMKKSERHKMVIGGTKQETVYATGRQLLATAQREAKASGRVVSIHLEVWACGSNRKYRFSEILFSYKVPVNVKV